MHEAVLDALYTQGFHINVLQQLSGDPNQLLAPSHDPLPFCSREKIQGGEEGTQGREQGHALALPLSKTAGRYSPKGNGFFLEKWLLIKPETRPLCQ